MAKFPTYEEMAQNVAEKAIDEYEYKGKTLRQWIEIISASEHGTNLAEVGTDCISREQAIDALKAIKYGLWEIDIPSPTVPEYVEHHEQIKNMMEIVDGWIERIQEEPPIQPTDNLQKLADEIASFKRCVKSDNSDYLTGYLCALSVVEGMIADMREVTT